MMTFETKQYEIESTFGIEGAKNKVTGAKPDHPHTDFVPKVENEYVFRRELMSDVLAWWEFGDSTPLYMVGPQGAGKSSVLTQIAGRLNWPVQKVTGHDRLETPDLIGQHVIIDGEMMFQPGPLTNAYRFGHLFIIDEVDLLDPGTAAGLNGLREGDPLTIPVNGGEIVHPAPGFRFAVTANTAGIGDPTGTYLGTKRLNGAFLDGFWGVEVGYPSEEQEMAILEKVAPKLPEEYRQRMIRIANAVREVFMGESSEHDAIETTISTRALARWAHLNTVFAGVAQKGESPMHFSLKRAITWRCEPETREFIHGIAKREMEG